MKHHPVFRLLSSKRCSAYWSSFGTATTEVVLDTGNKVQKKKREPKPKQKVSASEAKKVEVVYYQYDMRFIQLRDSLQ